MGTRIDTSKPLEIVHNGGVNSVAFSPDGNYIVTGCNDGTIQQWHVGGGKIGATMNADGSVLVIGISSDGKWIVSGGLDCKITVWDAKTQKMAFESRLANETWVNALDVSPGSTRFASASSDYVVNIWSLITGHRLVGPLKHNNRVECVAFSPDGDHLATAGANDCMRIWDSRDGELLVEVPSFFPESLVWWHDDRIFASTRSTQRWIDAFSGSILAEFPRNGNTTTKAHLAVSRNRKSLVGLDKHILRLWNHTTHTWSSTAHELGYHGCTIAVSPDSHHLVTGGEDRVSIWSLSGGAPENTDKHQDGVFMHLNGVVQELWLQGNLGSALEVLSHDIVLNGKPHHTCANRALVQARLGKWSNALVDAEMSIDVHPSVIGCIAKCIALSGQDRHEDSMQAFDLAFSYCGSEQVNYLLLVKSVVLFLTGRHRYAIGRITDLTKFLSGTVTHYCAVQAHMSVVLAEAAIESHDYGQAIQLLASVTDPGEFSQLPELLTVSLITGWNFKFLRFKFYQKKCEALFAAGLTGGAVASFLEVDLSSATKSKEDMQWVPEFRKRCVDKLNELGDVAMGSAAHEDAAAYYSSLLILDPSSTAVLIKRSKVHRAMGNWEAALDDANAAIALDPSDPWGYESKHAALHGAGRYDEAIGALTRELHSHYVNPSQTIAAIISSAKHIQRDFPLILIDTKDGHLCDEQERMRVFEEDAKFKQLVSSMVLQFDLAAINQAVQEFFRYATFSHTWDGDEPLYHDILHGSIHDLAGSPKLMKLLMFCTIVREAGFRWAWSDTCCINKTDGAALQESLTSMFQWYHESSLTVIHLKGVFSDSELGALEKSLWNTRAWTLQEFFASKVIRFYTEDWKPYLPHEDIFNHKESPVVMQEMARVTGIDAKELLSLRPGSENVREKLRLASTRYATKQEDIAYSLFGIFDVSIPVTYGEGQRRALGRLLQEVLTRSGDAAILAWTGKASDYNSCLPVEITVYRESLSPHLPSPIPDVEMETLLSKLETISTIQDSAVELYDRLVILPMPRLVSRRLSLSCIVFLLRTVSGPFAARDDPSVRVYRATASGLGEVEIRTSDDLGGLTNLVLVHPWLQSLFDPILPHEDMIADDVELCSPRVSWDSEPPVIFKNLVISLPSQAFVAQLPSPIDKTTRALRMFVRLRQPFGALLLAPHSSREYKRVGTDNPIVVRIRKEVTPHYLMDKIRTLDIL
ncbi:hypothetical protein EV363DRAFT_1356699 [Boletus edulis]|nr:hypothetical protein EV363DRAFT_1356699 [Boletus edulis]